MATGLAQIFPCMVVCEALRFKVNYIVTVAFTIICMYGSMDGLFRYAGLSMQNVHTLQARGSTLRQSEMGWLRFSLKHCQNTTDSDSEVMCTHVHTVNPLNDAQH